MSTLLLLAVGALLNGICIGQPSIWPLPQQMVNGSDTITICSGNFKFTTNVNSPILNNAIERFNKYLSSAPTMLRTRTVSNINSASSLCSGTINVGSTSQKLDLQTSENYTLNIDSSLIGITSDTIYGAMYGLTSLSQLIRFDDKTSKSNVIEYTPYSIKDYPMYNHRGVMLDSSRNFLSVDTIKAVFDGMALNKLNVFHWHIIDAQSFPFYSTSHPELSKYGAYSPQKIYQPGNISDVVNYAKGLGIRVIPEFDTPGHTMIISAADPDIMQCYGVDDNTPAMCPEPPCGYLDVTQDKAVQTILDVYKDAYVLFPDGFFHVGADEVNDACWGKNSSAMYVDWISKMCDNVNSVGKRIPILWSGAVDVTANIGQKNYEIVIQIWDNAQDKVTALKNGFKVIDSIYTSYYLDCGFSSWLTGGNSWCDPYKSWLNVYNHSITEDVPAQYLDDILGGEVCLWGEAVDDNNLQPRLWPRAAGAAERWWMDKPILTNDELNNAFQRLAIQRDWMVNGNGIISSPLQPEFCTLHPEYCNYYRDDILTDEVDTVNWRQKLKEYKLQQFMPQFKLHGWDMMQFWSEITFDDAKEMGFKTGHWIKFQNLVKSL